MILTLIVSNVLHAGVAVLWITGLRRLAGPLPPALHANLLSFGVVLPFGMAVVTLCGVPSPPSRWLLLRSELWATALTGLRPEIRWILQFLFLGTVAIFLLQEVLPLLLSRHH